MGGVAVRNRSLLFFLGHGNRVSAEATVASARERLRVGGYVAMLRYVPPGASLGAVTRARACGGGGLSCQVRATRLFLR